MIRSIDIKVNMICKKLRIFKYDESNEPQAQDELYDEAVKIVKEIGKAGASLLQWRLSIGYARAARLLDILEDEGIIGPACGAPPREVY